MSPKASLSSGARRAESSHINGKPIRHRLGSAPIIAIHVLAFIGVLFWLSSIIQSIAAGFPDG